ncbi:class I SAM-dependent methyltransferase [Mesobacillus maritimus]|uniref:class I SAM-dependent DNA methyltransferase n=1 Tax=Mesobacillus maritimus TaxID=1643336 RepID=UPI00203CBC3A|nr:class I SAM-dependent methyltransferase [Mesobacillus maritimus]MCM3588860.1 class I SAM-dependent methyltransferase [Mesobacillus maritimus]
MTYQKFAYLYDSLMEDVPYDRWVDWVLALSRKYQVDGNEVLDLACGTGELSVRLAKAGLSVAGVDLSEDMLAVAQVKAETNALKIPFYHQDMTELTSLGTFDMVGIFCDSLNYLPEEEDVVKTFAGVFQHLKPGGLFLFDVHSLFKMDVIFHDSPFTYNDEDISYIWECFPSEHPHSVEHELTFFVRDEMTGQYDRIDEYHYQRTYEIEQYKSFLLDAGFELLEISGDFSAEWPKPEAERILFAAGKPK